MSNNNSISKTSPAGLFQILRRTIEDDRGFFREPVRINELQTVTGTTFNVVQMNHARSVKNTLRGIHIAPWNKLIYVTRGKVQAVIVDLRVESATFGKYESFILGDENKSSIFVPKGFGNAYLVLSDIADYTYLTDQEWTPNQEYGVKWNDEDLAIQWNLTEEPVLSEKDKKNPDVNSIFPNKF